MRDSLIGRPTIRPKIQKAKLAFCCLAAVMFISLASIIVVVKIYNSRVSDQIQNISLLKDNNYKEWAQEPGSEKNSFINNFVLYDYQGNSRDVEEDKFVLSNVSTKAFYNFTYINASFAQGNKGIVGLVNQWYREPAVVLSNDVNNFNLVVNKVFNEQIMSPVQSRFPVLFDKATKTLKNQFLSDFYSQYLWQFFFQYKDLVIDTIFKPLKLSDQLQQKLLNPSQQYNWVSIEGLTPWIKLCLSKYYATESYFLIKSQYSLSSLQMSSLIGEKSQMHHLATALNSTIQNKIHKSIKSMCVETACNNDQLVAVQWANAFLTTTPFMSQINMNKLTGDLNLTHKNNNIEFSQSCEFYNNTENCLSFSQTVDLVLKSPNNLFNFSFVNFIVQNQNSPAIIESFIHLQQGKGQCIIDYVTKYFYQQYTLDDTSNDVFSWVWLVYQNFNRVWDIYQDFIVNNLFGRAFFSKWSKDDCGQYFTGDLENFKYICDIKGYKLGQNIESYFPYINAYFYRDRSLFLKNTNMSLDQSEIFFSSQNSLFNTRINQILQTFQIQYKCSNNECSFEQIVYRQWGSNDILGNLPTSYFPKSNVSILDWDQKQQVFNGYNIEYWSIMVNNLNYQQVQNIMNYDQYGVLGQFSLKNRVDEKQIKDPQNMINYLNQILLQHVFKGTYIKKQNYHYLFGYNDTYLQNLKTKDPLDGGKPWSKGNVSLVQLNNQDLVNSTKFTQYDELNTGIFDTNLLRSWKKRVGRNTTGYKYPVYMQNKTLINTWIDTGRQLDGTNMLGFHTSIVTSDVLFVFVEDLKRNVRFIFDKKITQNKFKFQVNDVQKQYFVGNDTANGYYAEIIPEQTYLIVETQTGQTIEAKILIKWYIKPGRFLPGINSSSKAYLYQQQILFTRPNQNKYIQIQNTKHTKHVLLPILITLACLAFVGMIVTGIFIFRWRKNLIKLEDDIDSYNVNKIGTDGLRASNNSIIEDQDV